MKTISTLLKNTTAFFILVLFSISISFAQTQQSPENGKIKIRIQKTENGKTVVTEEEFDADHRENLNQILQEYGIDSEVARDLNPGEEIEIIIRRRTSEGTEDENVIIEIDPGQEMVELEEHHFELEEFMKSMEPHAFLGVEFDPNEETGSTIKSVVQDSPAEKAGLKTGDIILKVNDQYVSRNIPLNEIIPTYPSGEKVIITYQRDGKTKTTKAELGSRGGMKISRKFECEKKPFLGVYFESENLEAGAIVTEVILETGAEKAGIQVGDVIMSVEGIEVSESMSLPEIIAKHQPGDKVKVEVIRDGKVKKVHAILGESEVKNAVMGRFDNDCFNLQWEEDFENPGEEIEKINMPLNKTFLGVNVDFRNEKSGEGVLIASVYPFTPAEKMGLRKGDMIIGINKKPVRDFRELQSTINEVEVGSQMQVSYFRDGIEMSSTGTAEAKAFDGLVFHRMPKTVKGHTEEIIVTISMDAISEEEAEELTEKTGVVFESRNSLKPESLKAFPNPSDGRINLAFTLKLNTPVVIRVFDTGGRKVIEQSINDFAGSYSDMIDLSNEPKGVYYLQIVQGENSYSKKLVTQ